MQWEQCRHAVEFVTPHVTQIVKINNINLTADLSKLMAGEIIYFNATQISQQHNKDVRNYTDSKQFKEYCQALEAMREIPATEFY